MDSGKRGEDDRGEDCFTEEPICKGRERKAVIEGPASRTQRRPGWDLFSRREQIKRL